MVGLSEQGREPLLTLGVGRRRRARAPFVPAVYYIAPNSGKAAKVADGITNPNGSQLSPDKKTLYVVGRNAAWKIQMLSSGYKGRAK
jgi:sugar lactone lactonase YvrE